MVRIVLILLLSVLFISGFAQSNDKREYRTTFYPLNIPYALYGRFQSSIEFGVNESDNLLIGGHYYTELNLMGGNGIGFETQYRINFNRDANVKFELDYYWGPFLEYDLLKSDNNDQNQTSLISVGMLFGGKYTLGNRVILDLFLGPGIANEKDKYGSSVSSNIVFYVKGGAQFGIKF